MLSTTSSEITALHIFIPYISEELDDMMTPINNPKRTVNGSLHGNFKSIKMDTSSIINTGLQLDNETYNERKFEDKTESLDLLFSDEYVKMPPKKRFSIPVKVVSITKAKPRIVESEIY